MTETLKALGCPICFGALHKDGDYYQCDANTRHRIHIEKEWKPYTDGSKDERWLRWRVKVRVGKIIQAGG